MKALDKVENKPIYLLKREFLDHSIVENLPNGRIDKQATGIGATTHEILNPRRNSIIVVPTRALAKSKAEKHYGVHYIGGDTNWRTTIDYIRVQIKAATARTKIMIVADSLESFIKEYGETVYKEFFILYDEIDIFQEDSNYRNSLQTSLEYYFKFPEQARALMSATIQKFSDDRLQLEPLTQIIVNRERPKIFAIEHRGSVVKVLADLIKQKRSKSKGRNILIGLNNFDLINNTIALLEKDFKDEIGVLCSHFSKKRADNFYQELNPDGTLPKPIVFSTSAYYTGIDINEAPFMIAVSDTKKESTLFTTSRLIQFFGRARLPKAQYTLIYNTDKAFSLKSEEIVDDLKDSTESISIIVEQLNSLSKKVSFNRHLDSFRDYLLDEATYKKLSLIKINDGILTPNYLLLDHIRIKLEGKAQLYSSIRNTKRFLEIHFKSVDTSTIKGTLTNYEIDILEKTKDSKVINRKGLYLNILNLRDPEIYDSVASILMDFIKLDFRKVNLEEVIKRAATIIETEPKPIKSLNTLYFQCNMYSYGKDFIQLLQVLFPVGSAFDNNVIYNKMMYIFSVFDSKLKEDPIKTKYTSTKYFNLLINSNIKRTSSPRLYVVEGINEWLLPTLPSVRRQYNLTKRKNELL